MTVTILVGDTRDRLKDIPDNSIQCCVTSPPYFGLRSYLPDGHDHKHAEIGLEPTLSGYIAALVDVFREVRRVLRDDGVVFLNLGDSYASQGGIHTTGSYDGTLGRKMSGVDRSNRMTDGLKPKDLMMVPARVAIALQDDGWYLRSHIIWAKKAPMPESVTDRPTSAHESIFLLTKSARYFWDQEAVREPLAESSVSRLSQDVESQIGSLRANGGMKTNGTMKAVQHPNGANLRNVWHLGPESFSGAHFATMPTEIPRRAIKAGTSERGCCAACGAPWSRVVERTAMEIRRSDWSEGAGNRTAASGTMVKPPTSQTLGWQPGCRCDAGVVPCKVLDPFFGSGTTGLVADELGRDCIGVELNAEYAELARRRIFGAAPLFASVDVA